MGICAVHRIGFSLCCLCCVVGSLGVVCCFCWDAMLGTCGWICGGAVWAEIGGCLFVVACRFCLCCVAFALAYG